VLVDDVSFDEELSFVATLPTSVIRPWTFFPEGSSTPTRAPTFARVDFVVSRSTVTTFRVEVVVRIVFAGVDAALELAPPPPPPLAAPPPALAAPADGAPAAGALLVDCCGTGAVPLPERGCFVPPPAVPVPVLGVPDVVGAPDDVGVPDVVDGVVVVACVAYVRASPV
jgi:hypothetical protein